jgi:3-hydroxyacyl-[acyl-carrier-protein] dehydratase
MNECVFDIQRIQAVLPHRYPFLLVDRVVECTPGERITAIKNVTANEPFFTGHFPQRLVMPGVLIIEALAQASGLLAFATLGEELDPNVLFLLVGVDGARFKRPVVPGDQLSLRAELTRRRSTVWKFAASADVAGRQVASAELMVAPGS